jgi:tRNA threonylcarbamoyladenosine biosynthesis protein TsaE
MKQAQLDLLSDSPKETQRIGIRLGEFAEAGDVFLLVGELGAGKTCLTQGITWGLGIDDYALSPSFVIMRELTGRLPLYHLDLFRLERIDEIEDLGLDDYLYGSGVCVVEWADKGLELLPTENLTIEISFRGDTKRLLRFKPNGKRYQRLISKLKSSPFGSGKNKACNLP